MTLIVEGPFAFNVTELDRGENETLMVNFSASISEPLSRDVMFGLRQRTDNTAASFNSDYNLTSQTITIPTNFSGEFETYIGIVILGDDDVEDDVFLVLEVTPLLPVDSVLFLDDDADAITVYIEDNDGMARRDKSSAS